MALTLKEASLPLSSLTVFSELDIKKTNLIPSSLLNQCFHWNLFLTTNLLMTLTHNRSHTGERKIHKAKNSEKSAKQNTTPFPLCLVGYSIVLMGSMKSIYRNDFVECSNQSFNNWLGKATKLSYCYMFFCHLIVFLFDPKSTLVLKREMGWFSSTAVFLSALDLHYTFTVQKHLRNDFVRLAWRILS